MARDPFSDVISRADGLGPHLVSDAIDEAELLPTILGEVRTFCGKRVDSARIDRDGCLGPELLAEVAAQGLFGLTVPEDLGGAGLSLAAAARVIASLARENGSLGTCVGLHSGLALYSLLNLGAPELRARYLPEIAAGKRIAAFAATEPSAGSDISSVRTTLREEGGTLRLSGAKCYVTNGGVCGLITVLARSPGLGGARAGHTLVLVDPAWPGVSRGKEEHKLGLKGSSTTTINFDEVAIPRDHVLGEVSQGLPHAHHALIWGRMFMAAGCLGSAEGAFETARQHAAVRVQFGRPLLNFPLVREALAEARASIYAVESKLRLVAALASERLSDAALPSTMLKLLASERADDTVDACLQLMGGAGYIEDAGMARRARDVRVTRIFEGANDVLRMQLAASASNWSLSALAKASTLEWRVSSVLTEARQFDAELQNWTSALARLRKTWGFRLFEQQAIASDLANAMVSLFSGLALLLRSSAELKLDPNADLTLARLALRRALRDAATFTERSLVERDPEWNQWVERVIG